MQGAILQGLKQWSRIRLHVIVENFTGCEASLEGYQALENMKLEQWRNGVCAIIGKDFQSAPIEYCSPSERARAIAWLTEGL